MSRHLLATTAITLILATGAQAEDISTAKTAPVRTSTVKAGAPDKINITTSGSITLTSGTAVTIDSNHDVSNAGTIKVSNANGAIGILALAGADSDITNSGTITIDEPYTPTDLDNDGDLDGPFALGSNRNGILVQGNLTGKIVNSGTITVKGNQSAGIAVLGQLTGNFVHDGKTTIVGDNSVGVRLAGVTGNVRLAGTVSATGANSVGAHFTGDVSGAVVVQGYISSTGYRYTSSPNDPSKLDADDLLQGGSALVFEGDVSGGILLAVAPKDSNPNNADEDADGIEDAKEGNAKIVTYGAAPAMVIGAAGNDVAIGAISGISTGYGLQIDGTVEGHGVYAGIDGTGLQIGGLGGNVSIANGIGISGSVAATSKFDTATGLKFGAGATTPEIRVTGKVTAVSGNLETANAVAIQIDGGATLPSLYNGGLISATVGAKGSSTAIVDHSGTLSLVQNSGTISATGGTSAGSNVAIDLTAALGNTVVRQTKVATGYAAPAITGDIHFGNGNDQLLLEDGSFTGDVTFGSGTDKLALSGDAVQKGKVTFSSAANIMTLAEASTFEGLVDFGGGADILTISGNSLFSGGIANAAGLAIHVNGGALDLKTPSQFAALDLGASGVLVATLSQQSGQGSSYTVSGNVSIADGAKLVLRLADVENAVGSYDILTAGSITGLDNLETVTDLVPYMFKADLDEDAASNMIVVDVARRTVEELGLNQSQASAYDAIFAALSSDQDIEDVFLGITNGDSFRYTVGEMLPDHAGGSFEGISLGTRTTARNLFDSQSPLITKNKFTATANLAFWGSDKETGQTAAYDLHGYSWTMSGEYETGFGKIGASFAYLWNQHTNGMQSEVKADSMELAAHWRGKIGPVSAFARGSMGSANFDSERTFIGALDGEPLTRKITGKWDGDFVTGMAGISAEGGGKHFFFRPSVIVDYIKLKEDGYSEAGGGEALDLTVEARKSDELGLNTGMALGYDFIGRRKRDENWFRMEAEGGWRQILKGDLGDTVAHFEDGDDFTLSGDGSTNGWYARARAMGGPAGFTMGGELAAEDRHGSVNLALRGSISIEW